MKIQQGTVYMANLDREVMGAVPNRMWWKPWRWQVVILPWYTQRGYLIRNLTKEGAIGVMKLYGIKHKDFEE